MPRPRTTRPEEVELPAPGPDGRIYVTADRGARIVGVQPRVLRGWVTKGWLKEAGREAGPTGQVLFAYTDVVAADAKARNVPGARDCAA